MENFLQKIADPTRVIAIMFHTTEIIASQNLCKQFTTKLYIQPLSEDKKNRNNYQAERKSNITEEPASIERVETFLDQQSDEGEEETTLYLKS